MGIIRASPKYSSRTYVTPYKDPATKRINREANAIRRRRSTGKVKDPFKL